MSENNLGRVQGGGFFGSTSTSITSIPKDTVAVNGVKPLKGDTIVNASGDLCKIEAITSTAYTVTKYGSITAETGAVTSVNGKTGAVTVSQEDIGLISESNFIPAGTKIAFTSKPTVFTTNTRINIYFKLDGVGDQCTGIEIVYNGQLLAMRAGSPYTIYNPSTGAFNYTDITLTQDYTFESTEIKQWLIAHTDIVVRQYHYVRSINGQTGDIEIERIIGQYVDDAIAEAITKVLDSEV